ncbi:MAG TPA: hypothetical protein VMG12_30275 [Polyangiaceae bacterium]|nr:hypothetical protein [Polyangiaceae bacterium]
MTDERSPRAEHVLMRIRASADPASSAQQRVLARVEQRIALEAAASQASVRELAPPAPREMPVPNRTPPITRVAGRLGRWGLFGLVAGAIGYQLGAHHERAVNEAAVERVSAPPQPTSPSRDALAPSRDAASSVASRVPASAPPPDDAVVDPSATAIAPSRAPRAAPTPPTPARATRAAPARATPARAATLARAAEPPSSSEATPALSMNEVLERLQRAQKAIHDGQPHAALAELDALDALERKGTLADERRVLRALALCDIGLIGDARQVLSQLEGSANESIYRGRLEQACGAALEP